MFYKQKVVIAKRRKAISKTWMALAVFGASFLVGPAIGGFVGTFLPLGSILGATVAGLVLTIPISFVLYRYLSKRFVHQQIG